MPCRDPSESIICEREGFLITAQPRRVPQSSRRWRRQYVRVRYPFRRVRDSDSFIERLEGAVVFLEFDQPSAMTLAYLTLAAGSPRYLAIR